MRRSPHLAELSLDFSRTFFLLWETNNANYEFADKFNHLYSVSLAREQDLQLSQEIECPYFCFFDELRGLLYVFIDNPHHNSDSFWARYDKIMLINGRDAFEQGRLIYDDYATHAAPPSPDDLLGMERYNLLQNARSDIFTVHYFDYRKLYSGQGRNDDGIVFLKGGDMAKDVKSAGMKYVPESSALVGVKEPYSRKMSAALKDIHNLFEDILYALDGTIWDDEDEKDEEMGMWGMTI